MNAVRQLKVTGLAVKKESVEVTAKQFRGKGANQTVLTYLVFHTNAKSAPRIGDRLTATFAWES